MEFTKQNQEIAERIISLLEQLESKKLSLPEFRNKFGKLKNKEEVASLFEVLLTSEPSTVISEYKYLKQYFHKRIPIIDQKFSVFKEIQDEYSKNNKSIFREDAHKRDYEWFKKNKDPLTIFNLNSFSSFNENDKDLKNIIENQNIPKEGEAVELVNVLSKIVDFAYEDIILNDLLLVAVYRLFNYFYNHSLSISYVDVLLIYKFESISNYLLPTSPKEIVSRKTNYSKMDVRSICFALHEFSLWFLDYLWGYKFLTNKTITFFDNRISFDSYDKFVEDIKNVTIKQFEPSQPFKDFELPKEDEDLLERFEMVEVE